MPVDKLTIEQFAQKIKAKYPEYKDVNDSVLVDKMVNKYPEYKERVNYNAVQQPVSKSITQGEFKPMTDWLSVSAPQSYQPMVPENEVNDHNTKVAQAKERVNSHLLDMDMDKSINNLIHDHKKELQGRIVSQQLGLNPREIGPVNPQAQELESQFRTDVQVTPNEVQEFKTGMLDNQIMSRMALGQKAKDIAKSDPQKAKELISDVYRLDRQNDPSKDEKISKNVDKIKEGEYDYDVVKGQLVKPENFFQSLVTGFKEKSEAFDDYSVYRSGDEKAIMDRINERLKYDPDKATPVPSGGFITGSLSEMARMAGGQPLKPLVGGFVSGTLAGPEAGAAAAAAISSPEMYKLAFGSALPGNYQALRKENPNLTDSEVLQKAIDLTHNQANIDALSGAAMGALGAKVGFAPTGVKNALLQKSIKSALKQIGQEGVKKAIEGLGVGSVGAGGQYIKNVMAQKAGIPVESTEGMAQQLWGGIQMTIGMTLLAKAPELLKTKTKNQLLQSVSQVPSDEAIATFTKLVESGEITNEQAQAAQKSIEEHKSLDGSIKPNVPESDRIKVQEKIQKRNELEANLEVEDKAYHADTKEKIKALNEEINDISKGSDRGELQKLIDKSGIQGSVKSALRDMSEDDLKGAFKEISEQAHDPNSANQAIEIFGNDIVNKAKELYPIEVPKESKISVIQPGDIKQPEIITIKPKENAIPIGSSEEVPVGQAPGYSQEMGTRAPESGEATGAQEGQQEAGSPAGQEGVGEPPVPPTERKGVFVEHPETQLSFRGLQDTANEFGFEDVRSRDPKTDLQTRVNAEKTANEWAAAGQYERNIENMLGKIDRKEMVPTDEQRLILEQYLANEKQKTRGIPSNTPEFDRQLQRLKRITDIGKIARSEAGAALRLPNGGSKAHPINEKSDAMLAKMEANKVDVLTDQQKTQVEAQVEKYKQIEAQAQAKTEELREKVASLDAKKEFEKAKSTTKRTKKTTEERVAYRKSEIEAAREALKKLRSGENGLSAVPLPGVRELMAIAPHVKNIMVDLVAQGVDNLQDVIKHLHGEFKDVLDGISEKDIHDIIAGEYNEKGKPLSELQRQIRDIQDEAKYINQYEALLNGKEPKEESAKVERNQKIKEIRDKIKDFRKEEAEADKFSKEEIDDDAKKLIAIKKRNQKSEQEIKDKIAKGQFDKEPAKISIFDREDVKKNYPNLRKEALDAISKKEEAQHEFDLALFKDEMAQRAAGQKLADLAGKAIHTSKAVLSGIDDSATFVQNGLAMLANPKTGAKVWLEHWKDAFSDARFKRELAALHQRPDWDIIQKSGLDVVEPHSAASKQVEEAFEKNLLAGKIKIDGKEYQPWKYTGGIFERAFTSMGNNFRVALFEKRMKMLMDEGKTFESHPREYQDAARAINDLTGRAKLPTSVAQAGPWLNLIVWAPKLMASTLNTLGLSDLAFTAIGKGEKGYYRSLTPTQRKFALSQLGKGIGMGVGIMGAASLSGAKVDYDPRSVTFGDIVIGNHHYNVFGRYVPVIKTIVQAAYGERLKNGKPQDLDSDKVGAKTRGEVVGGFFRGKMTPAAGTVYDLMQGRNYYSGKPFGVKDLPSALLQPMSVKELRDGWANDGTETLLNRFLPAFEGIKTSDERDFQKKGEQSSGASGSIKGHKTSRITKTRHTHKTH